MQNDEYTPDVELEENQNNEAEADTNAEATEDTENSIDWKAEAAKWRAIAKRNEQKQKPAPVKKQEATISRDEVVLLAQGYDEKEIEYLNILSKGKGVSLKEAVQDELFVAFIEKREAEKKSAKAKLGVSKSSGVAQNEPSFKKPMTAQEHKALFNKVVLGK